MTPRLRPLEPPYSPELAEELRAIMPGGLEPIRLFRTLAHSPRVLRKVRLGGLLDRGPVDRRDRELVILRTTALCGCAYEWGVHVSGFAARVGLGEVEVEATVNGGPDAPVFGPRERALLAMCDELHETARLSDPAWRALAEHFAPEQIVELLTLAGFYHAISFLANALRVEREPFAPDFPDAT